MSAHSRVSLQQQQQPSNWRLTIVTAWVGGAEEIDEEESLLPQPPRGSLPAPHHGVPAPKSNAPPGRQYDHLREKDPVVDSKPAIHTASRWRDFAQDFAGEGLPRGQIVDEQWWSANMPTYEDPSHVGQEREKPIPGFWLFTPEKRARAYIRFQVRCPFIEVWKCR
jgi:hypothetical protein